MMIVGIAKHDRLKGEGLFATVSWRRWEARRSWMGCISCATFLGSRMSESDERQLKLPSGDN